ncbi:hypothetical protein [Streptomyces anulatus]|uniref:hypothetical protein n=1 Tax=Streptomyces anulatus TaxID=1892 RepID=UPI0037248881
MTATTQQPRTALPGVDLERVTFEQAKGWRCALCDAILTADRSLGTYTADPAPHRPHRTLGLRPPMPAATRR